MMTTLGNRIQTLRKGQGLSQEQLAEILQVSRQALSKWELDASAPALEHIMLLSQHFGVSTDFLLTGKAPDPPPTAPPAFQQVLTPMPPRTAMIIGTIVIAAGLLVGLSAIANGSLALWLGIIIQLAGCGIFHAACFQAKKNAPEDNTKLAFLFYSINIWLLTLLPLMGAVPLLLLLVLRTNLSLGLLLTVLIISWLLCAGIPSFRWLKKYRTMKTSS